MFLLGYDLGSSLIKAALLDAETGKPVATSQSPATELTIESPKVGWAEQDPQVWWQNVVKATAQLKHQAFAEFEQVAAIGISYQMHGLVIVDKNHQVLRPSIIWCDSRAVDIGERVFQEIGPQTCLQRYLNSPGNFTLAKLKWVQENEPEIYRNIYKAMLPGDFIAMKMSDEITTTPSGLSEGIMWNFQEQRLARELLERIDVDENLLPAVKPVFSVQGELSERAAKELGLRPGTTIAYRAGDQPNNAFSLGVLDPGELAATAGTSGVVYGVTDRHDYDPESRVNTFVHVNHSAEQPRNGVLLCVNGTGILNRWLKVNFSDSGNLTYSLMNEVARQLPPGSNGLMILPYGNGAERTLGNKNIGAVLHGLDFNRHSRAHVFRAAQEGIAFALKYGVDIMRQLGISVSNVRAGYGNLFLSEVFAEIFATINNTTVELMDTDGAQGAARGAGVGASIFKDQHEAFKGLKRIRTVTPNPNSAQFYEQHYQDWKQLLEMYLSPIPFS